MSVNRSIDQSEKPIGQQLRSSTPLDVYQDNAPSVGRQSNEAVFTISTNLGDITYRADETVHDTVVESIQPVIDHILMRSRNALEACVNRLVHGDTVSIDYIDSLLDMSHADVSRADATQFDAIEVPRCDQALKASVGTVDGEQLANIFEKPAEECEAEVLEPPAVTPGNNVDTGVKDAQVYKRPNPRSPSFFIDANLLTDEYKEYLHKEWECDTSDSDIEIDPKYVHEVTSSGLDPFDYCNHFHIRKGFWGLKETVNASNPQAEPNVNDSPSTSKLGPAPVDEGNTSEVRARIAANPNYTKIKIDPVAPHILALQAEGHDDAWWRNYWNNHIDAVMEQDRRFGVNKELLAQIKAEEREMEVANGFFRKHNAHGAGHRERSLRGAPLVEDRAPQKPFHPSQHQQQQQQNSLEPEDDDVIILSTEIVVAANVPEDAPQTAETRAEEIEQIKEEDYDDSSVIVLSPRVFVAADVPEDAPPTVEIRAEEIDQVEEVMEVAPQPSPTRKRTWTQVDDQCETDIVPLKLVKVENEVQQSTHEDQANESPDIESTKTTSSIDQNDIEAQHQAETMDDIATNTLDSRHF